MSDGGYDGFGLTDSEQPATWRVNGEPSDVTTHMSVIIFSAESSDRVPSGDNASSPWAGLIIIALFAAYCVGRQLF